MGARSRLEAAAACQAARNPAAEWIGQMPEAFAMATSEVAKRTGRRARLATFTAAPESLESRRERPGLRSDRGPGPTRGGASARQRGRGHLKKRLPPTLPKRPVDGWVQQSAWPTASSGGAVSHPRRASERVLRVTPDVIEEVLQGWHLPGRALFRLVPRRPAARSGPPAARDATV